MPKKPDSTSPATEAPEAKLELFSVIVNGIDFPVLARDKAHLTEIVEKMRVELV